MRYSINDDSLAAIRARAEAYGPRRNGVTCAGRAAADRTLLLEHLAEAEDTIATLMAHCRHLAGETKRCEDELEQARPPHEP